MSGSERPSFSGALAVGRKLDLPLPDSPAVRDAYAHAEAESQPWLFNHVMRSWLYSAKLAQSRGLAPDAELVAVAVLLHDLGLARGGAPDRRFEVVGADIGRALPLRMIWGSAVQRQFGTRSRSTPPRRLRSIRAPTWPAVRTASRVTTADSVTRS
jgi:HD domain